jgi:uncharacterized Rmd1/YagE family protein
MMKRTKNTVQKPIDKAWDGDLSDFEKGNGVPKNTRNFQNYYQFSQSMPSMTDMLGKAKYETLPNDEVYTDDENVHNYSADEFAAEDVSNKARSLKTGRQRKKLAARSKGSEFRANRKKKRVYFCCISSEIDVEKMEDELLADPACFGKWKHRVYTDVLHLYKEDSDTTTTGTSANIAISTGKQQAADEILRDNSYESKYLAGKIQKERTYSAMSETEGYTSYAEDANVPNKDTEFHITNPGAQELFIFDFGAVVFWGVPRGEEAGLLKLIRRYASKGMVGPEEFSYGEDDMAFVASTEAAKITIQNDVIDLPWNSEPKQRLSVSFAIAQSSVLAIFEARIERKVDEYKYIPEALAAHGKIHLTELQLGMMIGEVFVIRHDVNLHTEILGTTTTCFW